MNKIDLKDVTFTIPVSIDHPDRLENLIFSVKYIHHHFDTNIMICESSPFYTKEISRLDKIEYIWDVNSTGIFHKTKLLNKMTKRAKTKVVALYDLDVILPVSAYIEARNAIINNIADFIYPYDGRFMECKRDKLETLKNSLNFDSIPFTDLHCLNPDSPGGSLFQNREKLLEAGGQNENMVSWAFEDNEIQNRLIKLGYRVMRTKNYLIHIEHWRGPNSSPENPYYQNNLQEYIKVGNMNKEQLQEYIKNWSFVK